MTVPEAQPVKATVIRSRRKTMALELGSGGLIVRAPRYASDSEIEAFLRQHRRWIETHMSRLAAREAAAAQLPKLTPSELDELTRQAKAVFAERAAYYAPLVGVEYGRITVRAQRTRWGSCSAKGNLNFNCLLLLAPPEVLDSVVVHELCHRKEMNHSPQFYREVLRVLPDYREHHGWLKEHGYGLLARLPEP